MDKIRILLYSSNQLNKKGFVSMKLVFIFILLSLNVFANGFDKLIEIKVNMPAVAINALLKNAQSGTLFEFQSGEYNLGTKGVVLNKNYIALRAAKDANVVFKNTLITFKNISEFKIKNIHFSGNSAIVFKNVRDFDLSYLAFQSSALGVYNNSYGSITHTQFNNTVTSKYIPIYIQNQCSVRISDAKIVNNANVITVIADNSNLMLLNTQINSSLNIALGGNNNAKIIVNRSVFNGITPQKSGSHRAIDLEKSSQIIVENSKFNNFFIDIFATYNSIIKLQNNKFENSQYGVFVRDNTDAIIKNCSFVNLFDGVYLEKNSYIESQLNLFTNNDYGIWVGKYSGINIKQDQFQAIKKMGITIKDGCAANIEKVKYKKGHTYCKAEKHSKIYAINNLYYHSLQYADISLIGIGDPQVKKSPILMDAKKTNISTSVFEKIKPIKIDFTLSADLLKGYTTSHIKFWNSNGEEELIEKGSYMILNPIAHKIIEPKEYRGVYLANIPKLVMSKEERNISITPIIDFKNVLSKKYISFDITSNAVINSIQFDGEDIDILYYTLNGYTTVKRRIRKEGKYPLVLKGKDFIIKYECDVMNNQAYCNVSKKRKF